MHALTSPPALVVPIGHSGKTGAPELSQFGNML
jgi:hypothetical protein